MYVLVESWTPKQTWLDLDAADREEFTAGVRAAIAEMAEGGIETLGWGVNDDDAPHRLDRTYVAVWRMPSREHARALEEGIEGSGWYGYFDQVNVRAELRPAADVLDEHVRL